MKINAVLKSDIDEIVSCGELFEPLKGAAVLVTGATGLIGSMCVRSFRAAELRYGLGITIIAQIRNEEKAKELFGDESAAGVVFTKDIGVPCTHIVHTLSPTASRFFIENPVETVKVSVDSALEMLETAKKNGARAVYLSSMEQYGVPYEAGSVMSEDMSGVIDHLSPRASYPQSKRLCECLCASYASEYGVDVKIARLAQTFGAGAPKSDGRMPLQFARAAAAGKDIVLHTEGRSVINSVYLTDAVRGILTVLGKGAKGEAYNICNEGETRSVLETARIAASLSRGARSGVRIEIPEEDPGFAPDNTMRLDTKKLRALGWEPRVTLKEAYSRLISYVASEEGPVKGD